MRIFLPAFALLLAAFSTDAQVSRNFIGDSLNTYIDSAMKQWQLPGMSVCIIRDNKVVWMKGYGSTEIAGAEKVDEHTLFMIGSNSKAFTGTALAILDNEKLLSLNDKVQKWIPEFRLRDDLASKDIMVRDLLCHRLGFETFQGDFTYWTSNLSSKEVIAKMALVKAPYAFRTKWGYCNAAFLTAGEIIPRVTQKTWAEFLKEKIFNPLGMNRTLALSADLPAATNKAFAHTIKEGQLIKIPFANIDNLAPAGSISSSASDMSHWVMMQLNNGKWNDNKILSPSVLEATRTPQSILSRRSEFPFNKGHYQLYGLGWVLGEYTGREIVSHTGGVNGYVSSVTLVPEEKTAIIILTNTDQNLLFEALKAELLDACLGLPFRNYQKLYYQSWQGEQASEKKWLKKMADSIQMRQPQSQPFTAFAGTYTNELYGKTWVKLENNHVKLYFEHHPKLSAELDWLGNNRFLCTFNDPIFGTKVIPFYVKDGKVSGYTLKLADFIEYTPYEFTKSSK